MGPQEGSSGRGIVHVASGQLAGPSSATAWDGVSGEAIDYVPAQHVGEDGLRLLPQAMRDWAFDHAGQPIPDPVTREPRRFWFCDVAADDSGGADGELLVFGRRGLVIVHSRTTAFVSSPKSSRWRHRRWSLPVDGTRVRHDHLDAGEPATADRGRAPLVFRGPAVPYMAVLLHIKLRGEVPTLHYAG